MYTCSLHIQIIHNQSLFLANFVIISSARLLWVDLLLQHSHTRAKPHLPVSCYHIHAARLFVVATLAIINMPQFAYIRLLGWVFITYTVAYVAHTFSLSFSPPLGLLVRVWVDVLAKSCLRWLIKHLLPKLLPQRFVGIFGAFRVLCLQFLCLCAFVRECVCMHCC